VKTILRARSGPGWQWTDSMGYGRKFLPSRTDEPKILRATAALAARHLRPVSYCWSSEQPGRSVSDRL